LRRPRKSQLSLVPAWVEHVHAKELAAISHILDSNPSMLEVVTADLVAGRNGSRGAPGMTGAEVVRSAVLKQMNGFTYEELAFHLQDSACYRAFCGYGLGESAPRRATLQQNVSRIRPETWEHINRTLVRFAMDTNVETATRARADATVVDADVPEPADSQLLWDTIRVVTRWLGRASAAGAEFTFRNHLRRAKRRTYKIRYARRKKTRKPLYRDLVKVAGWVLDYGREAIRALGRLPEAPGVSKALDTLRHFIQLGHRVVDQTVRRVFEGESVPSREKVVSLFEDHADIIVKGSRDTQYGHKITLCTGASALVVDCVIEHGNPSDSALVGRTLDRFRAVTGKIPKQAAFDGGYASRANVELAKAKGVQDICFNKRKGIPVPDMVRSSWIYRQLWRFRVGIESCISMLKRCFGLRRCTWHGLGHFKSYVWSSIVAYNLLLLARHRLPS